jgi:hypothetical protein
VPAVRIESELQHKQREDYHWDDSNDLEKMEWLGRNDISTILEILSLPKHLEYPPPFEQAP